MTKIFEDEFMEIQSDMVSLCLEYIDSKAERIYIYVANENRSLTFNIVYKIHGEVVTINKVNDALTEEKGEIDDNPTRTGSLLKIGVDDLMNIETVCKKYNQPVPTEMKRKLTRMK